MRESAILGMLRLNGNELERENDTGPGVRDDQSGCDVTDVRYR